MQCPFLDGNMLSLNASHKKTKITIYSTILLPELHLPPFLRVPKNVFDVISVVYVQGGKCAYEVWYSLAEDVTRGKKYFCFLCAKKSILDASQTEVEPLMSHGLFYRCIHYVSGPVNISVVLLSMEGQIALRFHQKYLKVPLQSNVLSLKIYL